jgi:L,D-transpeptidase catalytic domain
MRFRCLSAAISVFSMLAFSSVAHADIFISISKSTQQMVVTIDGRPRYVWPVSTGARGYDTPTGEFKPFRMEREHFSREWDDAPMPNSIFFTQIGHAIHGTYETRNLGRAVSHGCVRLSRANAATLFDLVKQEGMAHTRVVLTDQILGAPRFPVAHSGNRKTIIVSVPPHSSHYIYSSRSRLDIRPRDPYVFERLFAPRRY